MKKSTALDQSKSESTQPEKSQKLIQIAVSFVAPKDIEYVIQFYVGKHIKNKLNIKEKETTLKGSLRSIVWEPLEEINKDLFNKCIKELETLFSLKNLQIKINEVTDVKVNNKEEQGESPS